MSEVLIGENQLKKDIEAFSAGIDELQKKYNLIPRPYADKIPVLPCRDDDFISRTLKQAAASPG
jgi:hypothetical protein